MARHRRGALPRLVARHPEAFAHHAGPTSGSPWAETDRQDSGSWNSIVRAAAPPGPPHRWIALPGLTDGVGARLSSRRRRARRSAVRRSHREAQLREAVDGRRRGRRSRRSASSSARVRNDSTLPPIWRTTWPRSTTSEAMSPKQWTPSSMRSSARKISLSSPPCPAIAPRAVSGQVAAADHVGRCRRRVPPPRLPPRRRPRAGRRRRCSRVRSTTTPNTQPAGVGRRRPSLLHRVRGEPGVDHVTGRVDPLRGRPVVAVDDDPPAGVEPHAGLLEAEPFGVGRTAGGDEHGARDQDGPGGQRDGQPAVDPAHLLHVGAQDQPDAAPLELVGGQPGQLTVDGWQQALRPADQRRRDAERGEALWRTRRRSGRRRRRRCPPGPCEASRSRRSRRRRDRRTGCPRGASGGTPSPPGSRAPPAACSSPSGDGDADGTVRVEAGGPLEVGDAAGGEPLFDGPLQ